MLMSFCTVLYTCGHIRQDTFPAHSVRNWEWRDGVRIANRECPGCYLRETRKRAEEIHKERTFGGVLQGAACTLAAKSD